jgi:hypothetical protein
MLDGLIREMAVALRQEAEAAKKQGATRTNALRNGRLQDPKRQGFLYLFDIDRPLPTALGNDFPAEIEIHGNGLPGTKTSCLPSSEKRRRPPDEKPASHG